MRKLFLIDAIGAIISGALLLFLVIPNSHFFGIPKKELEWLIYPIILFIFYDILLYLIPLKIKIPFLRLIAIFNFIYCLIILYVLFQNIETTSIWGLAYFCGEIIIIGLISYFELTFNAKNHSIK